jgi:hypothetical protein
MVAIVPTRVRQRINDHAVEESKTNYPIVRHKRLTARSGCRPPERLEVVFQERIMIKLERSIPWRRQGAYVIPAQTVGNGFEV